MKHVQNYVVRRENSIAIKHGKMRNRATLERKFIKNKYDLSGETRDHLAIYYGEADFTV